MDGNSVHRALFESAPIGLAVWDGEVRYRTLNARLAEINGIPAGAHIGRTPSELLGEIGADAEAALRRVLETREPVAEIDFAGETPAEPGVRRHWLASFFPVPGGVGGIVLDVTERRLAAEREHAALEAAETAKARAEALARASTALGSSIHARRVLAGLVDAVVPSLADFCAVHLADRTGVDAIAVAVADPALAAAAHALAARQAADPGARVGPAAVARTGMPEVNASITAEDLVREGVEPEERELLSELGICSAAIFPLAARGTVLGALTLAMREASGRRCTPDLVELGASIASGAGLALDNARLFAEQAEVSSALQRTLLPTELPRVPGVRLAARYRASGRSNDVGGDFYDVFDAGAGAWALVIGDVVGKGAEAAAITAVVRATLQAAVLRGDGPRAALTLVDEALRRRPAIAFCSAVHGRLRVVDGGIDVLLLAAGHPPPLVLRADGTLEEVGARGTLLGVHADPEFGEQLVRLEPGDVLVLYTDGATELRGADPWRGEKALRDAVRAGAGSDPAELLERIEREALVLSGGELRDDLALLAVAAPPGDQ